QLCWIMFQTFKCMHKHGCECVTACRCGGFPLRQCSFEPLHGCFERQQDAPCLQDGQPWIGQYAFSLELSSSKLVAQMTQLSLVALRGVNRVRQQRTEPCLRRMCLRRRKYRGSRPTHELNIAEASLSIQRNRGGQLRALRACMKSVCAGVAATS